MSKISLSVPSCLLFGAVMLGASPALAVPTCSDLGTNPVWGLVGNPTLSAFTWALTPAAGSNAAYCQLNFTYSAMSGPANGYDVGQSQQIKIRVGLPLNSADGGTGGVQGAWNGRIQNLGGGGCVGSVGSVTAATNGGYVGSTTDTGHTGLCVTTFFKGDGTLDWGIINDFFHNGVRQQVEWAHRIEKLYYGQEAAYKYWNGCSTGGRQGLELARGAPDELDGILAGAPVVYWDRLEMGQLQPQVVMKDIVGGVIATAKKTLATNSAIAACDAQDGVTDGFLENNLDCNYSATALICVANGGPSSDPNCLTPQEAQAIDMIWDGTRNNLGKRVYFGVGRDVNLATWAGATPFIFAPDAPKTHHNPSFDWHTLTLSTYAAEWQLGSNLMDSINNINPDFLRFRDKGGKIISWQGTADSLVHYQAQMDLYRRAAVMAGGYPAIQSWWRYFRAPGVEHCGGGAGPQPQNMFGVLVNWVENGVAPDRILSQTGSRSRPLCPYPARSVYNGSGSTDDWNNFTCTSNVETTPNFFSRNTLTKYKSETQ